MKVVNEKMKLYVTTALQKMEANQDQMKTDTTTRL